MYQASAICRGMVDEMITNTIRSSRTRICKEILEETLVEGSWELLDVARLVKKIREGGAKRKEVAERRRREPIPYA